MADCFATRACSSGVAVCTFVPGSLQQLVSLNSRSNALAGSPASFATRKKWREGTRQRTRFAKVTCRPTRAGLGDAPKDEKTSQFTSKDWQYLGKVLAGCTAGAVLIKYGSILLPQITQPDLSTSLLIITAPVLVTVVVLSTVSSGRSPDA